jgi:hypothetical protein
MTPQRRNILTLERQVAARNHQEAVLAALDILTSIDERYGRLDQAELNGIALAGSDEEVALVFSTRFAAAFGRLLSDPEFVLSAVDYERLLLHHRWIDLLFGLSGFRDSDHLMHLLAKHGPNGQMTFDGNNLLRLFCSLSMNTRVNIDFEQFWRGNSVAAALAFLHYTSSRYFFQPRAYNFRERILEWLPGRLNEVRLGAMTLARLPEIYMHCSYAITPRKHEIKTALMSQMRRVCLEAGCPETSVTLPVGRDERPTVVVIAEHLSPGHAVFRTHSEAVKSLRERFRVVGAVFPNPTGTPIMDMFDECIVPPPTDFVTSVRAYADAIVARKPVLAIFLGVGMVPQVIGLASLRLAPIQCVSFGHTASTMSPTIDYFVLPEDFVAAPQTFSEKVLALPKEAMPTAPRPFKKISPRPPDGKVRIAIPASTMKLNPRLFEAIGRIAQGAKSQTEFHFYPLAGTGLPYVALSREVKARIPDGTVFAEAPHEVYMERLAHCDMFLCPFPYGNMNSIVDSFRFGLPGVCLDGPESHSHADSAYFARIGLPAELTAQSVDEYVQAAIKLIDDEKWRAHCRSIAANADLDTAFFKGDSSLFRKAMEDLIWPPKG